MAYIDTKLVNSICDRSFRIECTNIKLIPNSDKEPSYQGPGFISFNHEENLQATLFIDDAKDPPYSLGGAGSILSNEQLYQIRAVSLDGSVWTSTDIPKITRFRRARNGEAAIVDVELSEIKNKASLFPGEFKAQVYPASLRMFVTEKIDFPCNISSQSERRVGDEWISGNSTLDCAKFSTSDIEFLVLSAESYIELRAELSCDVEYIETRIQEAMLFTLSHPFHWSIMRLEYQDQGVTRICPVKKPWSVAINESPLQYDYIERKDIPVWPIFTSYFEYIRKNDSPNWHAISRHIIFSLGGGNSKLDLKMLRLGVAIEGVLADEYSHVGTDDNAVQAALSSLEEYLRGWEYGDNPECELSIKRRLGGIINQMKSNKNATARLNALLDRGVITKNEIDSWKRCRNSYAHGYYPKQLPNQKDFDDIGRMTTLLHKIIFQAIGYSGKYTDYGQRGWPTLDFRPVVRSESQ